METQENENDLKDDIGTAKNASLENSFSKSLEGGQPISNTEDESAIVKTTYMANKEEPFLAPKDPDDKPSSALKRRIKPMMPERN